MAIDISKLVSAAMMQDFIISKSAVPLAAGVITMYDDSNQTVLKNWYYQTGVFGNYSYVALPNPMTLSAAGTMQDVNGNDIIPFYYPWSETDSSVAQSYFVTVYDANGQLQFTRSNFPFVASGGSGPSTVIPSYENYIINNRFWRNLNTIAAGTLGNAWTTQYNNTGTVYYQNLCPGQHDGFSMPEINYVKNVNGSCTEQITFKTFPQQQTPLIINDVQPEFYINHNCTADTSGASLKVYQFPISLHLATLTCQNFTFTIQGQLGGGNATIGVYVYMFCGTGVASPAPFFVGNVTFNSTWTKTSLSYTFPADLGFTLGSSGTGGNDDAYYIQIAMPTASTGGAICNLNFAIPSLYLSPQAQVPTNSFATYDQIDSVVAAPRTGDVKISMSNFYPYGWVPMNDGTLAKPGVVTPPTNLALSYQGYDAWRLYHLLWIRFSTTALSGAALLPIYTSAGSLSTYGASAQADWNALKQIQLTKMMGQVILGTVPATALTKSYSTTFTASSSSGLLITTANAVNAFKGMTVTFSNSGGALPTGLSANTVYFVTADASFNGNAATGAGATTFHVSTTFANAMAGTAVTFTNTGSGTQTITLTLAGAYEGQYAHTQLLGELATHNHTATTSSPSGVTVSGATNVMALAQSNTFNYTSVGVTIANAGSSVPFNVTAPGTFFNMFMKL